MPQKLSKENKIGIAFSLIFVFLIGIFLGQQQIQFDINGEVEKWHTARMFEDGSWEVEYKDGTKNSGCVKGGLCRD